MKEMQKSFQLGGQQKQMIADLDGFFARIVTGARTAGDVFKNVWKEVSEGIGGATQQVTEAIRGVRQDILKADTPAAAPPTQGGPPAANGAAAASDSAAAAPGWVEIPDPDAPAADAADTATKPEPERAETAP